MSGTDLGSEDPTPVISELERNGDQQSPTLRLCENQVQISLEQVQQVRAGPGVLHF